MSNYQYQGFSRNINYDEIKSKLIAKFNDIIDKDKHGTRDYNNLMYITIALIQLRNASRISEAIKALYEFLKHPNLNIVVIEISKTKRKKINKENGDIKITKPRKRNIKFPTWINNSILSLINLTIPDVIETTIYHMQDRVLKYLLRHFDGCNTHSLRYAYINYLLFVKKKNTAMVAKFVGHKTTSTLVNYVEIKEADKLLDSDSENDI
jgi:integrase